MQFVTQICATVVVVLNEIKINRIIHKNNDDTGRYKLQLHAMLKFVKNG